MRIRSLHFETYTAHLCIPLWRLHRICWSWKFLGIQNVLIYYQHVCTCEAFCFQACVDRFGQIISTGWCRRNLERHRRSRDVGPEISGRQAFRPESFSTEQQEVQKPRLTQWYRFSIEAKSPNDHALDTFFYASQAFLWSCWALWIARKHLAVFDSTRKN